ATTIHWLRETCDQSIVTLLRKTTERKPALVRRCGGDSSQPYSETRTAERSEMRSPSDSSDTRSSTAWAPDPVGPRPSITGVPTAAAKLPSDPPGEAFSDREIPSSPAICHARAGRAAPSADCPIGGRVTAPLTSITEPSTRGVRP